MFVIKLEAERYKTNELYCKTCSSNYQFDNICLIYLENY